MLRNLLEFIARSRSPLLVIAVRALTNIYNCFDVFNKQDYNVKLSDFGLAKDGPVGDKSHVSTRIMGTYGYAAPEYIMTGKFLVVLIPALVNYALSFL